MPLASQFSQVSLWKKLGKMVPGREHRQCLLFLLFLLFLSIILDNYSYTDFLIIPTIPGKADNYGLLIKKGRDNFSLKGKYYTA